MSAMDKDGTEVWLDYLTAVHVTTEPENPCRVPRPCVGQCGLDPHGPLWLGPLWATMAGLLWLPMAGTLVALYGLDPFGILWLGPQCMRQ